MRVHGGEPAVRKPYPIPQALTLQGIADTIADFADAAANAIDAGFDGVELHGAYGYLIQQFLSGNANRRTDRYGGNVAGRVRFPLDLVDAVAARIGAERLALRISLAAPRSASKSRTCTSSTRPWSTVCHAAWPTCTYSSSRATATSR